jgi:hypothetical protein
LPRVGGTLSHAVASISHLRGRGQTLGFARPAVSGDDIKAGQYAVIRAARISTVDFREITGQFPGSCLRHVGKKLYFFQLDFSSGGGVPLRAVILAGPSQRRNPCEVRSSLSQFPPGRTSLQPTGQKARTRLSYADARFVIETRSLVTAVAASRLTTSITTGSGYIAAAAQVAERPSPFFRCSLFLTRITAL